MWRHDAGRPSQTCRGGFECRWAWHHDRAVASYAGRGHQGGRARTQHDRPTDRSESHHPADDYAGAL